jgi:hypothetical protein
MSDDSKSLPKPKPRRDSTPVHDLIVEFACTKCGEVHHLPILVDRVPALERDELGQLVKDLEGNYIMKTRVSFEYINAPRVHPAYRAEDEEVYRILYDRAQAERDFAKKKLKAETIAELLA